jgi:hypothetical protein
VSDVALFLGAGASRAFGYPTTEEFATNLGSKLEKEDKYLENILDSLRESPQIKDIEHILEFLDNIIAFDSNEYVRASFTQRPPQLYTRITEYAWADYLNMCRRLKQRIVDELHTQYEFDPIGRPLVNKVYSALFELMVASRIMVRDIFTTNYDTVVEEYIMSTRHSSIQFKLVDGFPYDSARRGRFWNPAEFQEEHDKPETMPLRLFKLHGSLNWRETSDNLLECLPAEDKCQGGRRYKRSVLIYPTQKGLETEEPFATMHKYFREASSSTKIFVVIGFSFRDPVINEIFLSHLDKNKKHCLLVVSPKASTNVRSNLLDSKENNEKYIHQIGTIDGEFGKLATETLRETLGRMLLGK